MNPKIGDIFTWGGQSDKLLIYQTNPIITGFSIVYKNENLVLVFLDYLENGGVILTSIFQGEL